MQARDYTWFYVLLFFLWKPPTKTILKSVFCLFWHQTAEDNVFNCSKIIVSNIEFFGCQGRSVKWKEHGWQHGKSAHGDKKYLTNWLFIRSRPTTTFPCFFHIGPISSFSESRLKSKLCSVKSARRRGRGASPQTMAPSGWPILAWHKTPG